MTEPRGPDEEEIIKELHRLADDGGPHHPDDQEDGGETLVEFIKRWRERQAVLRQCSPLTIPPELEHLFTGESVESAKECCRRCLRRLGDCICHLHPDAREDEDAAR